MDNSSKDHPADDVVVASQGHGIDLSEYPPLMTAQQVATVLGLSVDAVRVRIKQRDLASAKIGQAVRVPRVDLERYIARRLTPAIDQEGVTTP